MITKEDISIAFDRKQDMTLFSIASQLLAERDAYTEVATNWCLDSGSEHSKLTAAQRVDADVARILEKK